MVIITIGFNGCGMLYYEQPISTYVPSQHTYDLAKMEANKVKANKETARLVNYYDSITVANTKSGKGPTYSRSSSVTPTNTPKPNSIIGTQYDSFKEIRTSNVGVPITTPTQNIRLYIK